MGLGFAALPTLIVATIPAEQTGAATKINTIMRVIGNALGIQIYATIVARQTGPGGLPLENRFATVCSRSAPAARPDWLDCGISTA